MAKTFSQFTEGQGAISDGENLIGYANTNNDGERRYTWNTVKTNIKDYVLSAPVTLTGGSETNSCLELNSGNALSFEGGVHNITYNDNTGNFNIRVGNKDVSDLSTGGKQIATEPGTNYPWHMEWSQTAGWWEISTTADPLASGASIERSGTDDEIDDPNMNLWTQTLKFTKDARLGIGLLPGATPSHGLTLRANTTGTNSIMRLTSADNNDNHIRFDWPNDDSKSWYVGVDKDLNKSEFADGSTGTWQPVPNSGKNFIIYDQPGNRIAMEFTPDEDPSVVNSSQAKLDVNSIMEVTGPMNDIDYATLKVTTSGGHGGIAINSGSTNQGHLRFQQNGTNKWQMRCPKHLGNTSHSSSLDFYSWDFATANDGNGSVMTLLTTGAVGIGCVPFAGTNPSTTADETNYKGLHVHATTGDCILRISADPDNDVESSSSRIEFGIDGIGDVGAIGYGLTAGNGVDWAGFEGGEGNQENILSILAGNDSPQAGIAFGTGAADPTGWHQAKIGMVMRGGDQNVGIGGAPIDNRKLVVVGDIQSTANIYALSDIRVKDDIKPITGALNTVKNLTGVSYKRNDIVCDDRQIGLIAQDVEKVLPEVVGTTHGELPDTKSISYDNIVALLIEAIKEQQQQIDELKKSK